MELLTIKEVMEKLKISRMKLYQLTRDQKLPCYRIDRMVRYKLEDIEQFLSPEQTTANADQGTD